MKKTNPMLNLFCVKTKRFLIISITTAMVLSIVSSAFFVNNAVAQIGGMPLEVLEVIEDMKVTFEDLDSREPIIKRDSFFYPIKHLGRNIQEAFTFDPVKDAELKLQHANQELADIKQLVDDKGMENVNPDLFIDSVDWFENKLEDVYNTAQTLKDEKKNKPAEVEAVLNDFTDKHFYEHKILEGFHEKIIDVKDIMPGAEDIFVAIKDKQDEVLKHFGEVLTTVDDPEKIPERLAEIADAQEGSSFKLIKATEVLKKLEEQVPEQGKAAIENAQERTLALLEEDMGELAPIIRAEKFEEYTNAMPGDETVHLNIFEELKQLPDIPQDMLEKIEQVKEFAVHKFEEKLEKFEKPEVKDKFFEKLTGDSMSDIMVLEELKAKITTQQDELRRKIEQQHAQGLHEFKKQFTDVESQTQANHFEKLVKKMTVNPNPKIFRLIQELEMEVAQDAEKAAFIDNIKNKAKAEFENKFREEGDRFFDRMASLDPRDMEIFHDFQKQEFFDPMMMDQFFDHQIDNFKEHIQKVDDPEMFNRFQEHFQHASPEVINVIQTRADDFGDAMHYKMREMMEQEIMLKEREMQFQMERDWRGMRDDFELDLRQVRNDDEKADLFAQRREADVRLMEREFDQRKAIMEARFANDPFCDAMCQEFQKRHMELEFENMQWNLQEDARMREFEMEMHMAPDMGFDPFAGKCDNPESCMDFCYQNPDLPECRVHELTSISISLIGPPPCPPGMINMPRGPNEWECIDDPYWKPPEFFKECPPGHFWNEEKHFCEFNEETFEPWITPGITGPSIPACPSGEWWDAGRQSCIREGEKPIPPINFCGPDKYWDDIRGCVREDFKMCGPGEYFDFYEQHCKKEWQECAPGEYWDPGRQSCMRDVFVPPEKECGPGYFWDFYKQVCRQDQWVPPPSPPIPCPAGQWWDAAQNVCVTESTGCPDKWDPACGHDNITYSNECYAKQAGIGIQYWGECSPTETPIPPGGYCGDGKCDPNEYCLQDCETWCGDRVCQSHENQWSCPSDCGQEMCNYNGTCDWDETIESCPNDCVNVSCTNIMNEAICINQGCVYCYGEPVALCGPLALGEPTALCDTGYTPCHEPGYVCPPVDSWCGNGVCENGETTTSCPSDCEEIGCLSWGESINPSLGPEYSNVGKECCEGLKLIQTENQFDENCNPIILMGAGSICAFCGNGVCEDLESKCNCPEDCISGGVCGDDYCDSSTEIESNCPADCATAETTCASKGITAHTCTSDQLCVGEFVEASDTEYCCLGTCSSSGCVSHVVDGPDYILATRGITGQSTNYCVDNDTRGVYYCQYLGSPPYSEFEGSFKTIDCQTGYYCDATDVECKEQVSECGDGVCDSGETSSSCSSDCTAAEYVNLHSINISGNNLNVSYSKNFATCAHLLNSASSILHSNNVFCTQGNNISSTSNLSDFSIESGQQVKLCHGNNYNICSDYVTVTGSAKSITVTSPNAGNQLTKGNTYNINWQYNGWEASQYVHIDVCSGSGCFTLFSQHDGNLISSGSVSWTIGNKWADLAAGDDWYLRVFVVPIGWSEGVDYDKSDYFSIIEAVAYECTDTDGGKDYYLKGNAQSSAPDVEGRVDCCKLNYTTSLGDPVAHIGPGGGPCTDGPYLYEAYCEAGNHVPQLEVYECPNGCQDDVCITITTYCGDGTCDADESSSSCSADCGSPIPASGEVCFNAGGYGCETNGNTQLYCNPSTMLWQFSQYCSTSNRTCQNGYCQVICGDGICGTYESASDCPGYSDCEGEVMGVMSVREINKIDAQKNIFGKIWQTLKAIFTKDEPITKPAVSAHIPHAILRANPYLKERILWTEGDNYYKLISQYQPSILGAKTGPRVKFPLTTIWEILTVPFK